MGKTMESYDFGGYATKSNIRCSDGRTIAPDAFKHNDGMIVPLVWNHLNGGPENVLGKARLENRGDGVYAYGSFNDSKNGQMAKTLVEHGDIYSLSICANNLSERSGYVIHGDIREVSLVIAGANPDAFIDNVMKHGEWTDDEAIMYFGEELELRHSDDSSNKPEDKPAEKSKGDHDMTNDKKLADCEETVADIWNTLSEKQKNVAYALIGMALAENADDESDDEDNDNKNNPKGGNAVKHNIFDSKSDPGQNAVLKHSDQMEIIGLAKSSTVGSLKTAIEIYSDEHSLEHGINNIEALFPEYKDVRPGAPELLTTDQGWIGHVMKKVHKSPISRIRTRQADIRNIEALRAKGYEKGKKKTEIGNFNLLHRTTEPQTVYVKSDIKRDDVIDITDFDVVSYLYSIDRMNLNEELATAIMLGDGREEGDPDKIYPDKIRPVWLDDELYTIHADVDIVKMKAELQGTNTAAVFGDNYVYAEAFVQTLLYTREKYKGSGSPDLFITPHLLNVMLLARDMNGRRIYSNVSELASTLNVGEIITAEQFEGKIRTTSDNKRKKLLAIMINLNDYYLGANKGGEITHFTDFDINFNLEKSLLETRCSGANTRVLSAIALEEDVTSEA